MTTIVGTPQLFVDGGSYTAEAGSDRLLVVVIAKELTTVTPFTDVTFGGVSLTALAQSSYQVSGSTPHVEIWYLPEASIPSGSQVISATATHSTVRGTVYTLSGASQSPTQVAELGGGQDVRVTGSLTGLSAGDIIIAGYCNVFSGRDPVWNGGISSRYNDSGNTNLTVSSADGSGVTGTYNIDAGYSGGSSTDEQAVVFAVFPSDPSYTITSIDGDNNVQAGQSNVDIVMTATTGVTSVTLGGESLTINGVT